MRDSLVLDAGAIEQDAEHNLDRKILTFRAALC